MWPWKFSASLDIGPILRSTFRYFWKYPDIFGNILASNQIDKFGKQCLEDNTHIYWYRDAIPIAPLTMCDDLLVISECGFKTDLAAAYINSQAEFNSLQFGLSKCSKMHVGKTKQRYKCNPIYLDQWKTEEIENTITGKVELQESFAGKVKIN